MVGHSFGYVDLAEQITVRSVAPTAAASSRTITVAEPQRADLFDAAFCAAPITAHAGPTGLRLAATRTEVPPGEIKAATPAPDFADTEPPLWGGIGELTYKITTASTEAQAYFDQGLRLAFGFNHGEAQRAFRKAQKLDPTCAMCFWGEAYVLGPNINLPMQEDAIAPAFAAARRAHELAPGATPKEQALIAALSQRYGADPKAERAPLDAAYAAAMRDVAERFPDDNEIAAFYAEAVMDLSPWDYWRKGGREPNPLPTSCEAPCRAPATSCTCRATSSIASGATSTRSPTTKRRLALMRNTLPTRMRRWASTGSGITHTTSTS